MNEQALNDAYQLFTSAGYGGNIENFTTLMSSNTNAFNDAYNLFTQAGYNGDKQGFSTLIGLGKQVGSTVDSTVGQDIMESKLDDGSLVQRELPQVDVTASQEDDTWIERTVGKNIVTDYFGDLWRAGEQGLAQGATVDEAFDVYKKGKNISDEELKRYIEVSDALDKTGASDEMREYEEIKNEAGGGVWGFMKGMVMTRGQVIPQVIVSSAAAMGRTFFDSEEAALATGTGAALAGTAGSFVPIVGTATGAIGGAVAGLVGSMETALTLTELLKTELDGKDFNKENIRAILEDEELFEQNY